MSPQKFADKYLLAVEQALKEKPSGGLNGLEQEWNLLDEDLRPLLTVGAGPSQHSFVDYLRAECIPPWQAQFSQLEVFHCSRDSCKSFFARFPLCVGFHALASNRTRRSTPR
jgi:hypothetical protein